jgi:2,4-dienoyl-CoA reductase-like NADH-dependent reductase (Old Yellow Enzyme family)
MCQYMAVDGKANEWHLSHYASIARGGAGLVIVEATAVAPEGRITPGCTGIWSDELAQAFVPVVQAIKAAGAVPGIQIGHAGRKASANRPWEGDDHIAADDARGWDTLAPSAIAFGKGLPKVPKAMSLDDIAACARTSSMPPSAPAMPASNGWNCTSPTATWRRASSRHIPTSVMTSMAAASKTAPASCWKPCAPCARWPEHLALTVRFGVLEYDGRDEQTLVESIALVRQFKESGMDMISVTIGFTIPEVQIPWGPAFLGPIAQRVREEAGVPVSSAWGFGTPELAERAVKEGQLDLVMVGRSHLVNPHWPYQAARELGVERPSWTLPAPYAHWLERY